MGAVGEGAKYVCMHCVLPNGIPRGKIFSRAIPRRKLAAPESRYPACL